MYDAWGNHTVRGNDGTEIAEATHIGNINPIRYRGYYYDTEIGLYYLQTRYYDPTTGRFVTIDGIAYADPESINGLNLYAYCGNNPVMNVDPDGTIFWFFIAAAIGAIVGALSYTASTVISYVKNGEWNWSWGSFFGSIFGGVVGGILSAIPGLNFVLAAGISGFITQASGMLFQNFLGEADYSAFDIIFESAVASVVSMVFAGVASKIRLPGVSGRGGFKQVTKQIYTKLFKGNIKKITLKTFGKMFITGLSDASLETIANGLGIGILISWIRGLVV